MELQPVGFPGGEAKLASLTFESLCGNFLVCIVQFEHDLGTVLMIGSTLSYEGTL
jgi:hypothetical protein